MKNNLKVVPKMSIMEADARLKLARMEEFLSKFEQAEFEVKHIFTEGVYIREIFLPAGSLVVGKLHRHNHFNFISKGEVTVFTKDGLATYTAPVSMISTAGTKRAVYAHTDVVWSTVHHNPENETDLAKLEAMIIAPSYKELL